MLHNSVVLLGDYVFHKSMKIFNLVPCKIHKMTELDVYSRHLRDHTRGAVVDPYLGNPSVFTLHINACGVD